MGMLAQAGAEITPRAEDADVIVVNTCSFIESAQQESVNTILEMARHKTGGRARKLVVAGCLVERFRNQIQKDIPEVDAVVGTGELPKILEAAGLARHQASGLALRRRRFTVRRPERQPDAPKDTRASRRDAFRARHGTARSPICPIISTTRPRRACWRRRARRRTSRSPKVAIIPCSFCIIPQLRGKFRSRRFESVIAEAERLARGGRARDHAHRPGHHLLRRGFRAEGRPGAAAGKAGRHRRAALDPVPVRLSQQDHRAPAGDDRARTRKSARTWTCRCSTRRRRR